MNSISAIGIWIVLIGILRIVSMYCSDNNFYLFLILSAITMLAGTIKDGGK